MKYILVFELRYLFIIYRAQKKLLDLSVCTINLFIQRHFALLHLSLTVSFITSVKLSMVAYYPPLREVYLFSRAAKRKGGTAWFRDPVRCPWAVGSGTNRLTDVLAANWPLRSDLVISLSTPLQVLRFNRNEKEKKQCCRKCCIKR